MTELNAPVHNGGALGYYRYPAINGDCIIFTAEGDLWRVGIAGGLAQRLTTHDGIESHAAISPDGALVAFSAQYEGPTEVYAMPVHGGRPRRLTYEDEEALVAGWTPDGRILYATKRYSTAPNTQLGLLDSNSGAREMIPLHQAANGCYDAAGETLYFTRLPFQGSHTKRYTGGTAQNIWKFAAGAEEATALTADYAGASKDPMWHNGRIYFATDRDGTMNIWSMDEQGGSLQQHTFHKGWDVKTPAQHNGRIVYQLGADLYLLDVTGGETTRLDIFLASDFDQTRRRWVKRPLDYLDDWDCSPDGDRLTLTARGRIFTAPVSAGRLVEVTPEDGVRYRNGRFLPDGQSLVALSDASGELEFVRLPADGVGAPQPLTTDGDVFRFAPQPSPDGKWLAYADKNQRLWLLHLESGAQRRIAESQMERLYHYTWSPDSRWLAYVEEAENMYPQIKIYGVEDESTTAVTSDRVDSYSPVWSPDGKWLYFLSDRAFESWVSSPWGPRQPDPYFAKTTRIYMLALQKGERSPFQPLDELYQAELAARKKENNGNNSNSKNGVENGEKNGETAVVIDFDGIAGRLLEVPLPPGNYNSMAVNKKALFWVESQTGPKAKHSLMGMEIKHDDPEPQRLAYDIKGYTLSANGEKLFVQQKHHFYQFEASGKSPKPEEKKKVNLDRWTFAVDLRQEWRQMFIEAWRLERDYFYDRNLHGLDWPALLQKHLPLVERVTDRDELNDLLAQMVGELSALHTFVQMGDRRTGRDVIRLGSLGAVWQRDEAAGGYRINHIYRAEPDYPERQAPLARPGVDVVEGEVITAVNGAPLLSIEHPALLLHNQAGRQVRIRVASPDGSSREVIVVPITTAQENGLRYDEWEYTNRLFVEEQSEQQIGYVHVRAMGGDNYAEWAQNFYPVFDRSGLIIDMRYNRGGNIDSWILGKLLRRAWFYWQPRIGRPSWNMQYAFRGHMVVLCNEWTASDGEAFTEGFRRLGLGKVIGTRTWGGEIWLSRNTWLVDKGIATAAQIGVYSPEGEWLIEGHGVEPDIVVDNLPHATYLGQDAQLETAVNHLLALIAENPVPVPQPPPHPDKSFDYGN